MNYSELLDNVRNYTEVTSDVLTNTVINVFIKFGSGLNTNCTDEGVL